ncbi:MAG TPA: hypothetical protein VJA16_13450, partial [Thermoanaerobaculia bacterium]
MHDRARAWPLFRRPVDRLRLGAGGLLALLLLAGAGSPAAETAPAGSAAAGAPKLRPLPAELERRMPELVRAAESYRGLKLERRVPWGRVSEPELRREVIAEFREDLPPRRLAEVELGLKAFALIPESMDLGTYVPELLTSQIAGFYDPHRKSLAVVDRPGGLLGSEAGAQLGAEMAHKMEDGLLVHELTHAIQDQHFDLDRLSDSDPLSDGGVARLALVEGDATLVMMDDLIRAPLEDVPEARSLVAELTAAGGGDEDAPVAGKGLPGQKEMATAPAWFRDQLLFSYSRGAAFCLEVRRRGGQKLLDYAFAVDPPRSSEQILHPEKWFGRRDDPVVIAWPDLGRELPGYAKAAEGQLGEEGIAVLLRPAMPDGARAAAAAAGWGGDRFAVYQQAGRRLLAWIADWDTEEAAARFQAAASRLGAGWTVVRAAPRRVTVLRGDLAAAERGAVLARLAAARAEPPANHDIDLARLGVRPEPADPAATRPPGPPGGARSGATVRPVESGEDLAQAGQRGR